MVFDQMSAVACTRFQNQMLRLGRRVALRQHLRALSPTLGAPSIHRLAVKPATKMMASGGGGDDDRTRDPASNPRVVKLRKAVNDDAEDGWEKCWEEGVTPWDLGQTTPVVAQLVRTASIPTGTVLVPGCGSGYDVVAMAGPERYVVGLDISATAIEKAKKISSSLPNANRFTFVAADFFTWQPREKFDLIFDYTFFCAIDPSLRLSWAKKIQDLLKPDGELITLIYLISDQEGGPPFNNTVADYEEVLNAVGFKALVLEDNVLAVKPRQGREKLARWKQQSNKSLL